MEKKAQQHDVIQIVNTSKEGGKWECTCFPLKCFFIKSFGIRMESS